jgi:zeta-carotene desaturase
MEQDFVALLDSRIHWVFNKSKIYGSDTTTRQYLSLVISGAASLLAVDSSDLVKGALKDLSAAFPTVRNAELVHSLVVKEKRATFSPFPDVEAHRPSSKTQFENLFLAGDWTDTGYPATIEGAVLSGRKAAEGVARLVDG